MKEPDFTDIVGMVSHKTEEFMILHGVDPGQIIVSSGTWHKIKSGVAFTVQYREKGASFMGLEVVILPEVLGDFLLVGLLI